MSHCYGASRRGDSARRRRWRRHRKRVYTGATSVANRNRPPFLIVAARRVRRAKSHSNFSAACRDAAGDDCGWSREIIRLCTRRRRRRRRV